MLAQFQLDALLADTFLSTKEKTETISRALLEAQLEVDSLIAFAAKSKDPVKATCIEAFEFATNQVPGIANVALLEFVSKELGAKAPRVKWESAKVIAHIAHLFPANLSDSVKGLLVNTEHTGTVVRWSAATALGEILKLNLAKHKDLKVALESICEREEKNSIKKIYQAAFKKSN